jgi:hypothetical protein
MRGGRTGSVREYEIDSSHIAFWIKSTPTPQNFPVKRTIGLSASDIKPHLQLLVEKSCSESAAGFEKVYWDPASAPMNGMCCFPKRRRGEAWTPA